MSRFILAILATLIITPAYSSEIEKLLPTGFVCLDKAAFLALNAEQNGVQYNNFIVKEGRMPGFGQINRLELLYSIVNRTSNMVLTSGEFLFVTDKGIGAMLTTSPMSARALANSSTAIDVNVLSEPDIWHDTKQICVRLSAGKA